MERNEIKEIEAIRNEYTGKERTKLDELRDLDRKVKLPAEIFAYSFGIISSLVLGLGMCLAMGVIAEMSPLTMILGIAIGALGIVGVSVNYFAYLKILGARKKQFSGEIIAISNELLGE